MTKAVIEGKIKNETANPIRFSTDFRNYLKNIIKSVFIDDQSQITWYNYRLRALLIKLAELFVRSAIRY